MRLKINPVTGNLDLVETEIGTLVIGGTVGSVLFVDGDGNLGQDNANLFWDDSNNRLGIGTNAPISTLDVHPEGVGEGIVVTEADSLTRLGVRIEGTNSGGRIKIFTSDILNIDLNAFGVSVFNELGGTGNDFRLEGGSKAHLFFLDAGVDAIGIDYTSANLVGTTGILLVNGNVGIGTATPDQLIHAEVADAATNTVVYPLRIGHISSGTVAANFGVGIEFELEGADGTNNIAASIEAVWSDALEDNEDGNLIFKTRLSDAPPIEQMRLSHLGRLGLGTTEPARNFHLMTFNSIFRISDSDASNDQRVTGGMEWFRGRNANRVGGIQFLSTTTDAVTLFTDYPAGFITFSTGDLSEKVRITSTGLVGFNETAPDAMLEIVTNATTEEGLKIKGTASQSADLFLMTDSSDVIFVTFGDGLTASEIRFNDAQVDIDFVVEGSGVDDLIYANAGLDFVGIVERAPTSTFDINGSLSMAIVALTSNTTLDATDHIVTCGAGNETFTVTLPAASGITGRIYHIKNIGTGTITVDGNSSETIDGGTTAILNTQFESIMIVCDGSNWHVI